MIKKYSSIGLDKSLFMGYNKTRIHYFRIVHTNVEKYLELLTERMSIYKVCYLC